MILPVRLFNWMYRRLNIPSKIHYMTKHKPLWVDQPLTLQIDTHNFCNLACIYCNVQGTYIKQHGILPFKTIRHVLKYFQHRKIFINYVRPFMNGEPMLETRMPQITSLIKKTVGAQIHVYTNGSVYRNRPLLHDPNLDQLKFTISAATPETYLKVHGKPLFHDVLKTLNYVVTNRFLHQRFFVNFVLCEPNWNELEAWKKMFKGYFLNVLPLHEGDQQVQSVQAKGNQTFTEALNLASKTLKFSGERPCPCWQGMSISYKGELMQCCDVPYEHNWGHVEEIDLMETWRKRADLGLNHPACRKCNFKDPNWKETFEKYVWT